MIRWDNIFKLACESKPSMHDETWMASMAEKIRRRRLADITAFFLESTAPLHSVAAQAVSFLGPALSLVLSDAEIKRFIKLLENPAAVSRFIEMLGHGK